MRVSMFSKKTLIVVRLVVLSFISLLFMTCDPGLGKAVDTQAPKVSINFPETKSVLKGGFVMKGVEKLEKQMWKRMHKHERKFLSKFKNLVNALEYEMGNHECSYTGEYTDCLPPLGFSYKDLKKNKRLRKALIIARKNQYKWYKKHGW
jgi:hypothetical protein